MWLADQMTSYRPGFLTSTFLRFRGCLDAAALRRALTEIVTAHEVLRTSLSMEGDEVVGILRPPGDFHLDVQPVDALHLDRAIEAEASTPLDVTGGLPLRARLLRLAADDHVLCLVAHHLAFDHGSVAVLYRELAGRYEAFAGSRPGPPPARLTRQFRDVAGDQDVACDTGRLAPLVARRCAALARISQFELPPDHPRPPARSGKGAFRQAFDLPEETVRRLTEIGRGQGASLYMVLLAASHALLYRYTGRSDVTTGTSSSTRGRPASEPLVGPFLNMLVMPGDVSGNPSFTELVRRVRDVALDAYEARQVAFDTLVAALGVPRDPARTPVFQVLVDFTVQARLPDFGGLRVEEIASPGAGGSKYDLTIEFVRHDDGLQGAVEWDTALYEAPTVMRLMAHLRALLRAVANDASSRVDDIPILSPGEIGELRAIAEPADRGPARPCLHELFGEQAARTPDAVAVEHDGHLLSYAQLDHRSTLIARGLRTRGAGPDTPVGVMLDRSPDLVAAVLGILKAGAAYLPVDPDISPTRAGTLLRGAGAPVCVVPGDPGQRASAVRTVIAEAGCVPLGVTELISGGAAGTCAAGPPHPDHLCAVYSTSGSTGEPKRVGCTHRGWVSQMENMQERYRLAPGEAVLLKTPLSFDDVAREIFWPLMTGGRVVVLGPGLHHDPRAILQATITHRVVWLQFVPSTLEFFLDQVEPGHVDDLRHLRHVVSDGDWLRPEAVRKFFGRLGPAGCRLNNHWGTTEVAIDSTHHACTPEDGGGDEADAIVLGRPMEGNSVYVLDQVLQPMPRGAIGELCIGGIGLGRGYLGDPRRTARAFVPHPWQPGERLYRTGDTGRLLADGSLRYQGRRDHQVKVRGVRIELGEVEAAVRAFPGVTDAAVATWEPAPGDHQIVAYAVAADAGPAAGARLREFLTDRLPPAAVPRVITVLGDLPRAPSGKLDRRSLPEPDPGAYRDREYVMPSTDAEESVAQIWATVLGVPRLGASDDFFASGGHSLLVTRAVNRMRAAFAVDIPIRLVFEHPTVRGAAAQVEELILTEIEAMSEADAEQFLAPHARQL
jgi:amino acid adenylation domain-containing protein